MIKITNDERKQWNNMIREIKKLREENEKLEKDSLTLKAITLADKNDFDYEYDKYKDIWLIHSLEDGYEDILVWYQEQQKEEASNE